MSDPRRGPIGVGSLLFPASPLPAPPLPTPSIALPPRYQPPEHVPTSRLFAVLARRKWLLLAVVLITAPAAVFFIKGLTPYYDAQATLMINTRKAAFRDLQATVETTDADSIAIGTQVGIIRSPAMAARIVDRLDLAHTPNEFNRLLDYGPSARHLLMARIGRFFGAHETLATPLSAENRRQLLAQMVSSHLTVLNDGHSYIISLQARTNDPFLSASIANSAADLYLDFNRQLKIDSIRRANSLLDTEIEPLREHLRVADEAVETYRQKNGLIGADTYGGIKGGGSTVSAEQLSQVNAQLTEATGELAQKQASLQEIQAALHNGNLDSLPEVMASPLIATLRAQQSELASKLASISQTAGSGNPAMQTIAAASQSVQSRINAEVGKIARSIASEVAADRTRIAVLRATLNQSQGKVDIESRANVALRQLEADATAARGVYQDYLGRFEHTSSDSALQEPEADLISAALVPLGPSGPPVGELSALVVLGALTLSSLGVVLYDRTRSGMRTAGHLEAATGLFPLGIVPHSDLGMKREYARSTITPYTAAVALVGNVLRFGSDSVRARVVLVTSAVPGEGKTLLATSLAASVGREGGIAMLIDCDFYRPSVAATLELGRSSQALAVEHEHERNAMLRQSVMPGLDVLTFKQNVQLSPAVLDALRLLISDARDRYDLVVLDAPPVLAFADAQVLSSLADGTLMAVRWRHTPTEAVSSALRILRSYGARIVGGVVTQVRLTELDPAESGQAHVYRKHANYFH